MHNARTIMIISLVIVAGLVAALFTGTGRNERVAEVEGNAATNTGTTATLAADGQTTPTQPKAAESVFVYCAAGLKPPVEAIAKDYEREYHTRVELQYGGSGTLLSNLRVSGRGDLFIAGDSSYIGMARGQKLIDETMPVAQQRPVLAVAKGNPKGLRGLQDLAREDVKAVLANPDAASIGKVTRTILEQEKLWEKVQDATTRRGVFKPTVGEVANDLKLKTADAGIVWDATLAQYPELEGLPLAGAAEFNQPVTAAVLRSTRQPRAALHFARYLSARDKGLETFKKMGYEPAEGDDWEDQPEIVYYSGAVNRVAIQDRLQAFEEREGARITTVFNGCGILLGMMKLGTYPDVYHTCDASFMKGVEDKFSEAVPVTEMAIVILAAKGNPHGLRTLADLGKPGLKIMLANEQQSTLGALTAEMLRQQGIYDAVQKNVVGTTPTGDMMVNQMRTGSLDAAVVYKSNTIVAREFLDVIPLDLPGATATQTFAIGRNSHHKQLIGRLFETLQTPEAVAHTEQCGFKWLLPK